MPGGENSKKARKATYFVKLRELLADYPKILIVGADNVGSSQMQKIRISLRGEAVVLMGKNTQVRKVIREDSAANKALETLLPLVKGNVGFVFTKGDLSKIRDKLLANKVGAPAKAGAIAPNDVNVPKGPTGLEPTQTSFLQALNIASKINKGQVEIINDVALMKKGDKVGSSEAALLAKLNIRPFSYGLSLLHVYDHGHVYEPSVLDIKDEDLLNRFREGVANVAGLSLALSYPTLASLPHALANAFKRVLSVAVETQINFPEVQKIKDYIANPSAFAVAAAPVAAAKEEKKDDKKKEEKKEEKVVEEEDDDDMFGGGGLFGDD